HGGKAAGNDLPAAHEVAPAFHHAGPGGAVAQLAPIFGQRFAGCVGACGNPASDGRFQFAEPVVSVAAGHQLEFFTGHQVRDLHAVQANICVLVVVSQGGHVIGELVGAHFATDDFHGGFATQFALNHCGIHGVNYRVLQLGLLQFAELGQLFHHTKELVFTSGLAITARLEHMQELLPAPAGFPRYEAPGIAHTIRDAVAAEVVVTNPVTYGGAEPVYPYPAPQVVGVHAVIRIANAVVADEFDGR